MVHFLLKIIAGFIFFTVLLQNAHAWWNNDWEYRKNLVLDTTTKGLSIDAPLLNPKVLIRLHLGNFVYFTDIKAQGSDLRFIYSDDATPLNYQIETIDTVAGIANIWLELPDLKPDQETTIYMYYGNSEARNAQNIDQFWPADDVIIYPFNELSGVPKDNSAFGHHAVSSSVTLGVPGIIGAGVGLSDSDQLLIGTSQAVDFSSGFTFSTWLKSSEKKPDSELLSMGSLSIKIDNDFVSIFAGDQQIRSQFPLNTGQWHHITVAHDSAKLSLYVDGKISAEVESSQIVDVDNILLGATEGQQGFVGTLDDLRISTSSKGSELIKFNALANREDSKLIAYSEDESKSSGGNNFGLIWTMLDTVRIEGWVIIALLGLLGLLSFDIIVAKSFYLRRAEKNDQRTLEKFSVISNPDKDLSVILDDDIDSPLSKLLSIYNTEIHSLKTTVTDHQSGSAAIEVLRSALDEALVNQADELNKRVALVTMAITGGPFLGLLGTVMGVMITFATISAAGDVNVRTIAPGVAAALTTTVLGLAVAIPSLFGYNYVAGRISKRITAMEVFSDKLLAKAAVLFSKSHNASDE